jgi:hypothetical protein
MSQCCEIQIRDVYPESRILIFPSRIPDPTTKKRGTGELVFLPFFYILKFTHKIGKLFELKTGTKKLSKLTINYSILNTRNCHEAIRNMGWEIQNPGPVIREHWYVTFAKIRLSLR